MAIAILQEKNIIITGASGGIGKDILHFAENGWNVIRLCFVWNM
jgi:short-subunit dehydrogenase